MSEPASRSYDQILEDLDIVTGQIAHAESDELAHLIPEQEALIREMNSHPDNPTNKPR